MTPYSILVTAEQTCHTIEIREVATGKEGVANTQGDMVAVFYGADDGSDDKVITAEQFNSDFEITACIAG
ncbi:MAG: hypothetical protein IJ100_08320 [Lachnospiraceae bacterium]|nr:hypothetical protein [Lachnospiraceae bacterium]